MRWKVRWKIIKTLVESAAPVDNVSISLTAVTMRASLVLLVVAAALLAVFAQPPPPNPAIPKQFYAFANYTFITEHNMFTSPGFWWYVE